MSNANPAISQTADETETGRLEMGHVLFLDIVDYSSRPAREQVGLLAELQRLIRSLDQLRHAEGTEEHLCLPTGDGMALVFFRDPLAPVQAAISLSRRLRGRSHLSLRMGIHSGPVYRVRDINAHANVSGGGINLAQRVMDCGDAGHILLSRQFAEIVEGVAGWSFHDLGEHEVKHGARLHLFNLFAEEFGNPERPTALSSPARASTAPDRHGSRVAVLYRRGAAPDERLVRLLESELVRQGHEVFLDRCLPIGVEWAREIDRQVRTADAVIPLLSAASAESEMLAHEVQLAHEAAARQGGRPQLLPVRVAFEGPLPAPVAGILTSLNYALWTGPEDDQRVLAAITEALERPAGERPPRDDLMPPTGVLPLDSRYYVVRPTDHGLRGALARGDSIVRIRGARQMGKTSLLARGMQQAREAGAHVVMTDFQTFSPRQLESAETFFTTLARWLAKALRFDVDLGAVWDPLQGPNWNFREYLLTQVLERCPEPLVWGMDEVDMLFGCDFSSEVFGLFRSWHNERALHPHLPWSRFTLVIAHATEAHLFIADLNQSPFNVGTTLTVQDFSLEQTAELNERYDAPLRAAGEIARYQGLLGGHPYLTHRGLHELAAGGLGMAALETVADRDDGPFGDHLRRMLTLVARDPDLCEATRAVLRGQPCPVPDSFYRLWSAGVLAGETARAARPRCELYARYLRRHLQ